MVFKRESDKLLVSVKIPSGYETFTFIFKYIVCCALLLNGTLTTFKLSKNVWNPNKFSVVGGSPSFVAKGNASLLLDPWGTVGHLKAEALWTFRIAKCSVADPIVLKHKNVKEHWRMQIFYHKVRLNMIFKLIMPQLVYAKSQSNFCFPFSFMTVPFLVLWIPTDVVICTEGER